MLLPELLFLGRLAPMLIRVAVSAMLMLSSWKKIAHASLAVRAFALVEIVLAAALFVGSWTQAVAIVTSIVLALSLVKRELRSWPVSTVALMFVMTITLIFTEAGAFAIDWPF